MIQSNDKSKVSEGGLYIHIPFCRNKCIYCDFFSIGVRKADIEGYMYSLENELRQRIEELPERLRSIYFGGGTPSIVDPSFINKFIGNLQRLFPEMISGAGSDSDPFIFSGEFTFEVNPEDVTIERCREWKNAGVNRISMGIQSFDDNDLKFLRRTHSSERGIEAIGILQQFFDNISIDLIFGLPGQTIEGWIKNLKQAIELKVNHISLYSLMFEEGTALTVMRSQGRIKEADENLSDLMFLTSLEMLGEAGFHRYEISNYSLPGYESVHNSSYWKGFPYLGLGAGAHSYDGKNIRRYNPNDIKGYINFHANCQNHSALFVEEEILSDNEKRDEFLLTRLRMAEGIFLEELEEIFTKEQVGKILRKIQTLTDYIEFKDGRIRLTDRGVMISDKIILELAYSL